MYVVGIIATTIAALGVLTGLVVAAFSVPDLRRYRRLRRM